MARGKRSRLGEAIDRAQHAAEAELKPLGDEDYVDACDEIAAFFEMAAQAKREELARDDDGCAFDGGEDENG